MMNIQSDKTTGDRIDRYRKTMAEAGYDEKAIAQNVAQSWVWRNVFFADTDAEAEAIGVRYFRAMWVYLSENRQRMNTAAELAAQTGAVNGAARDTVDHGLIYGSPETVCEKLEPLQDIGVGGIIIHFRLGSMPWEAAEHSLRLFAEKVAPELGAPLLPR